MAIRRKAYVATLDAFMAMSIAMLVILLAASRTATPQAPRSLSASLLSSDVLETAYLKGELGQAIQNDSIGIRKELDLLPSKFCPVLTIYSGDGTPVSITSRQDCAMQGRYRTVSAKSFFSGGGFYVATLASWYE